MTKRIFMALLLSAIMICSCLLVVGCKPNSSDDGSGGESDGDVVDRIPTDDLYIVEVQMITPPNVSSYGEGDIFDPTGMVLKVIWNDGLEQLVYDGKNCIFSPTGPITLDTEAITATYDDKIFTLPVTVNKIVGIQVLSQPSRTVYAAGEQFSTAGLKVISVLENGEIGKKQIIDYTLSANAANLSTSDNKVVINYQYRGENLTCEVPVNVLPADKFYTFEAEKGTVTSGTIVTSGSSLLNFTSGGFVKNLKANGSIAINIPSSTATTASLHFVMSSYEGSLSDALASMDIKINEAIKIEINGVEVAIGDDQILRGGPDDERGEYSRFCHWYELVFDNVQLNMGNNSVVITSKVDVTNSADLHSICYDNLRVFTADSIAGGVDAEYKFHFTPSTTTSVEANYADGTNSIFAEHMTIDGVAVTKFTVSAGTVAGTGVGLKTTNATAPIFAQSGYPTVFPALKGVVIPVTLHITNTGSESISIHYAIVNPNGEMGKVDVTVEPGETKDVTFNYNAGVNDSGNNHLVALNENVTSEASFTIWGEIDITEAYGVTGITVLNDYSTHKTKFVVGETFSSDGLVLKPIRSSSNLKWFFVHDIVTTMDGKVFTEEDIGTHTVTVCFAGFYATYEIIVIDAEHQHTEEIDEGVAATCTESGLTEGKHCSECNEVIVAQEVIPALGHTNSELVVENNIATTCAVAGSYDNVVYCSVCSAEVSREKVTVDALGHNYVDGKCSRCGKAEPTVSVNIADYASSNGWEDLSRYYTIQMDDIITLNASEGGNNNGKFVNGTNWKVYRGDNGTLTVSAAEGYVIVSITVTYEIYNNGVLVYNGSHIASGTELTINSDSAVFSVSNTNSYTNGQVGFTNIDVVYAKLECTHENTITTTENATCTEAGSTTVTCDGCGWIVSVTDIPALGHSYVDGQCSYCGAKKVSINIEDHANSEEWENLKRYYNVEMDDIITLIASENGNNNGKFVNGREWKLYRGDQGTLTVSAAEGYIIVSITVTYENSNSGVLVFNGTDIATGTELTVNSDSAVFSVGNTNDKTNGQIGFTNIEVVYAQVSE